MPPVKYFSAAMLLLALPLYGCVHSQADANSKSWVGAPASALIEKVGKPDEVRNKPEGTVLIWRQTNRGTVQKSYDYYTQNADGSLQAQSSPYSEDYEYTCTMTYVVNSAGIIVDGKARGECQ